MRNWKLHFFFAKYFFYKLLFENVLLIGELGYKSFESDIDNKVKRLEMLKTHIKIYLLSKNTKSHRKIDFYILKRFVPTQNKIFETEKASHVWGPSA